jgi:DNA-binding NarL/FixJ family response regulator
MTESRISVAIVDDHPLFRAGVIRHITDNSGIEVLFEASNGLEMQEKMARDLPPQVVLLDVNMPVMDGYDSTVWIRKNYPGVRVLALSMFEDDDCILKMIRAGAGGYLLKESRAAEVIHAVRSVAATGYYLNEKVSGKLIFSVQKGEAPAGSVPLSAREQEFIRLCCSELTYKEIASEMHLSAHTVENYREALFSKLDLKSRVGLVLFAVKNKLIEI